MRHRHRSGGRFEDDQESTARLIRGHESPGAEWLLTPRSLDVFMEEVSQDDGGTRVLTAMLALSG